MALEPLGVVLTGVGPSTSRRRTLLKGGVGQVVRTIPQARCLARCTQAWRVVASGSPWVRREASDRRLRVSALSVAYWTASDPPFVESKAEFDNDVFSVSVTVCEATVKTVWMRHMATREWLWQVSDLGIGRSDAPCQWVRWSLLWQLYFVGGSYLSPMASFYSLFWPFSLT
jgi:hypothetical protein